MAAADSPSPRGSCIHPSACYTMADMALRGTLGQPGAAPTEETTDTGSIGHAWRTVLFNCDCHSFDQVERQLIKATHCTLSRARQLSWEVHSKGSSVVYHGHRERCEAVAECLGAIGLLVNVSQ